MIRNYYSLLKLKEKQLLLFAFCWNNQHRSSSFPQFIILVQTNTFTTFDDFPASNKMTHSFIPCTAAAF